MKSCLIVDDSKVVRMVARKILESLNFQIQEAENGQAAMDCCKQAMPDAILLDWNMPVMNGLALVRAVRADPRYAGTRLVMVTSETEATRVVDALAAGADEYAMKPFTLDVIAAKLEMIGVLTGAT